MRTILFVIIVTATVGCLGQAPPGPPLLKQVTTIPLPGVRGRIDHMAVDAQGKRLYAAALGNDTLEIVDLEQNKVVGRITGLDTPQCVVVLPDSGQVIVASGGDGKVRIYDPSSKLLGAIDHLDDADNARYDPDAKLVYVGYGDGALAVIDPVTVTKVADIKLDGHPESFQIEAGGKRIFVNVPSAGHVAVIDRAQRTVIARWLTRDARSNFPMALDEGNHRLFVACRRPAKLLVLNTESGASVAALDCCGDADDVFYDAIQKRVYVSGGAGWVSVFDQTSADGYQLAGTVTTAAGARTSLLVPPLHRLIVAVPAQSGQQAELRLYDTQAPSSPW